MSHNNQLHNDTVHKNNNNTKFPQNRTQSVAGKNLLKKNKKTVCSSQFVSLKQKTPTQNAIRVGNKKAEWRR
jgi:hypothetical protein